MTKLFVDAWGRVEPSVDEVLAWLQEHGEAKREPMGDLEKAIERIESDFRLLEEEPDDYTALVIDAARQWANLTSPETKRRAVLALAAHWSDDMSLLDAGDVFADAEEAVEVVLRSVEEGE